MWGNPVAEVKKNPLSNSSLNKENAQKEEVIKKNDEFDGDHATLKLVTVEGDDNLMQDLENMKNEDERMDVLIDSIIQIRTEILMNIQANMEDYVEGGLKTLSAKVFKKLKDSGNMNRKKTEHALKIAKT